MFLHTLHEKPQTSLRLIIPGRIEVQNLKMLDSKQN